MTTFLFVISFALHILAFFLIILLYLKLSKVKEVETRQSRVMKDMENAVAAYLLELREENEKFIQKLSTLLTSIEKDQNEIPKHNESELPPYLPKIENIQDQIDITSSNEKNNHPEREQDSNMEEMSLMMQQALQLHKQGKSIEEIARILEKGKTEIELLLKFRQM
jgi:hypothetical protein